MPLANAALGPEDARMPKARVAIRKVRDLRRNPACPLLFAFGLLSLCGCSKLTYERIRLGMSPAEYDRALDLDRTTRTAYGLVQYAKAANGNEDALLLTLAEDRRISGKMRVSRSEASDHWPLHEFHYFLRAEFDTALIGAAEAGPIDALRLITQQLSELPTERSARRGQILVLAGLVRILQRQPGIQNVGLAELPVGEFVGIVPEEGVASLERDASGRLHVGFRVGQEP